MVRKLIIPSPSHYAAIRLNPVAMVEDLGLEDEATLAEARRLETKTYLAYLVWPAELPLPRMRWCRYNIEVISTTLRKPDPEAGITADMVVPIAPNTSHPAGREPIHTTPPFPFPNCFHWINNHAAVRIRTRRECFELYDGLCQLSGEEQVALTDRFSEDYERIGAFFLEQEQKAQACSPPESRPDSPASVATDTHEKPTTGDLLNKLLSTAYLRYAKEEGVMTSSPPRRDDALSSRSKSASDSRAPASSTSSLGSDLDDVLGRTPDPTTGLIPLVDAWMDIEEHLRADSIPSPDELEQEVEEVIE
ncbi:hypothetical protein K466DRAFT_481556 [Polyporus arcularius HHB13444]|uniref:Uncharacterized protein n=1 Tax=Polyporus arcularius HHB13444 TaxID=1314778 RepID=A0A5C3PVS8_9APHY|nr:hypothetical protein K466DRAFT_481556 [Polyporus arcularius HHB13444]